MLLRLTLLSIFILTLLPISTTVLAQSSDEAVIPVVNFYYPKNAYRFKVSEEIQSYINRLKEVIREDETASIKLLGYANDGSNEEWNTRVSKYRVRALRDILIANGIAKSKIEIEYFGKKSPIAKDDSNKELAKNRRVELRVDS